MSFLLCCISSTLHLLAPALSYGRTNHSAPLSNCLHWCAHDTFEFLVRMNVPRFTGLSNVTWPYLTHTTDKHHAVLLWSQLHSKQLLIKKVHSSNNYITRNWRLLVVWELVYCNVTKFPLLAAVDQSYLAVSLLWHSHSAPRYIYY